MADSETIVGDSLVWKTQNWLNETYGERTGYSKIDRDGITGAGTVNALLKAFQIELGITNTSTNFGPTTTRLFNERFPNGIQMQSKNDSSEDNIYAILHCACWCKGYSTGENDISKHFYTKLGNAIIALKLDAGVNDNNSTVTLNILKALLSMDQFRVIKSAGGTAEIRKIQQTLNRKYENYIGIIPCDGIYGRSMNIALIKVLQIIEGSIGSDVDGVFGNGTKAKLPLLPSGKKNNGELLSASDIKNAISLLRYSLYCNGYEVSVNSQNWDAEIEEQISKFQEDMILNVNATADVDTWMALLLSKGNKDRKCTACDTRYEMTDKVLNYIKSNGYEIVGRYLTGESKGLKKDEAKRIIDKGIKLFPIFQESGTNLNYFTNERGKKDAKNAVRAARKNGMGAGAIIYFAVDTDPVDSEIDKYILPYFKGIIENIGPSYKVGVYGTRNVCSKVMEKKYATTCFVSDMSTGFSGNMGFKMPKDWNFDQFHELKNIGIGSNVVIDLDKDAYSGKFPAVSAIYETIYNYNPYIKTLEDLYINYKNEKNESCTSKQIVLGITNFLRSFKYEKYPWFPALLATIDNDFIEYVKNKNNTLYEKIKEYASKDNIALCDIYGGFIDIGHLAATIEGYISATLAPAFWFGWGGDLASIMKTVHDKGSVVEPDEYLPIAEELIGEAGTKFSYTDICTDADAIKISEMLENTTSNHPVSETIEKYYLTEAELRNSYYLKDLENAPLNLESLKNTVYSKMSGIFENTVLLKFIGHNPSPAVKKACCEAFAEYIINNYPTI